MFVLGGGAPFAHCYAQMSFFGRIFGTQPPVQPKEHWDGIIAQVHGWLRDERPIFFSASISMLEELPGTTIIKRDLAKPIELNIAVYQVVLGFGFAMRKGYVKPEWIKDFLGKLFAPLQQYGTVEEIKRLAARYRDDPEGGHIFRFYSDLATSITGNEAPLQELMLLTQNTNNRLTLICQSAFAKAFGDQRTVQELVKYHKQRIGY